MEIRDQLLANFAATLFAGSLIGVCRDIAIKAERGQPIAASAQSSRDADAINLIIA